MAAVHVPLALSLSAQLQRLITAEHAAENDERTGSPPNGGAAWIVAALDLEVLQ